MSRKLSGPRSKSSLSATLDQRLKMYSLAASTAGVSVLTLAQPARAEVVVTPKNLTVVAGAPVYIDMTGEGRADFELVANSNWLAPEFSESVLIAPLRGAEAVGPGSSRGHFVASRLVPGAVVGPSAPFAGGGDAAVLAGFSTYVFCGSSYCHYGVVVFGPWAFSGSTAYLGVKFGIAGHIHYGWIRLAVTNLDPVVTAKITAYAYETEPDTPILVPPVPSDETDNSTKQEEGQNIGEASVGGPSLGMLASGAHGLPLWRREEIPAY
jgi:hypothetical protein